MSVQLFDFPGGIHPPENKNLANQEPIQRFGLPPALTLHVKQHIGQPGDILVACGERVLKGQPLTEPGLGAGLPVHAPTSGTVEAIERFPTNHPSCIPDTAIRLVPDGKDEWITRTPLQDISTLAPSELTQHLQSMGIAGLGGAGFPTAQKLSRIQNIETLIINGAECEPYIVSDDRLMREHAGEILEGTRILKTLTKADRTIIAVEDNKPEAIAALQKAVSGYQGIEIVVIPTKYPSGGEKQLIQILTGQQVPENGLPADIGIVMQNTGTAYAVSRAVNHGEPLIERIVTLTGQSLKAPGTAWVLLGTPIRYLLDNSQFEPEKQQRVIIGGPMMGYTVSTLDIPVTKTTNCILAPTQKELPPAGNEMNCIRCGHCAEVCPASLLPQQLYWYARDKDYDGLKAHNLADCIECGACAWVCPSEIPLVHYYRKAKAEIREQVIEQQKAEIARQRFEARQARLEREKQERLEKHRKAAEARKKAQAEREAKGDDDPVKAALERVKKKKAAQAESGTAGSETASSETTSSETKNSVPKTTEQGSDKKAAVKAAVERAKARKKAQQAKADSSTVNETEAPEDRKKAAVKAAVERAKARKKAQQAEASPSTVNETEAPEDKKKAAVKAAVERAKARKKAQAEEKTKAENKAESKKDETDQ